jgi:hypothetical protein
MVNGVQKRGIEEYPKFAWLRNLPGEQIGYISATKVAHDSEHLC